MKRLLLALACLAPLAAAAEDPSLVSLRAQADREVPNDQIVVLLAAEEGGADPAALAAVVNKRMAAAMAAVRGVPAVKARSAGYSTVPVYKNGRVESWRASQLLRLESSDFAAMASLVGELQAVLMVRGMQVGLAPETRRAAEDALITEALAAFQARAEIAAKGLKAKGFRVKSLDVGTSGGFVRPLAEMAGARSVASSAPAPIAVEAGVTAVSVSASGTIELR